MQYIELAPSVYDMCVPCNRVKPLAMQYIELAPSVYDMCVPCNRVKPLAMQYIELAPSVYDMCVPCIMSYLTKVCRREKKWDIRSRYHIYPN